MARSDVDVVVHPDSSLRYYGFYLEGVLQALPGARLRFGLADMPVLPDAKFGLALLVGGRRIFIAADDRPEIDDAALAWSDVYGAVNLATADLHRDKVVALGPSFGLRWGGPALPLVYSARAARVSRTGPPLRSRLKQYVPHQRQRAPLSSYVPHASDPDRLFYAATFWHAHPAANEERADFLRAAMARTLPRFEGGFVSSVALPPEFEGLRSSRAYSHAEYLERLSSSAFAFNTPAVHGCLGWKLGEFLALGKAVVTTPIERPMPGDVGHGHLFHEVDGTAGSFADAIERLTRDDEYRRRLERAARAYWDRWLAPPVVMRRLLAIAAGDQPATER